MARRQTRTSVGNSTPFISSLPFVLSDAALADADDVMAFMEQHPSGAMADKWFALLRETIATEAEILAGEVGFGRPRVPLDGGEPYRRVNFKTSGGSPWAIYYETDDDVTTGRPILLRIVAVRHGRSEGATA